MCVRVCECVSECVCACVCVCIHCINSRCVTLSAVSPVVTVKKKTHKNFVFDCCIVLIFFSLLWWNNVMFDCRDCDVFNVMVEMLWCC